MKISDIPQIVQPLLDMHRIANIFAELAIRTRYLEEARTCPGAAELVVFIEGEVATSAAKVARLEASLPLLESSFRAHAEAHAMCVAAAQAHGHGSTDRKTALKLRDDLEVAQQAERVTRRDLETAKLNVPGGPINQMGIGFEAEMRRANEIVASMSAVSASRIFKKRDGKIPEETWAKWLEVTSDHVMWLPLALKREIDAAEAAWKRGGTADEIHRRGETHPCDPDDLRRFYKQLLEDRESHKQMKLHEAKRRLAQAEIEAQQ